MRTRNGGGLLAVLVGAAIAASGCGSSPSPSPAAEASVARAVMMKDPWVKTADSGMSAVFGTLLNPTGADVTVVSATASASAMTEMHEVAVVDGKMQMRPKEGGFVIPAKGSHELKPGGDHLMLMDITTPVKPGSEVTVTLTFKDGGTLKFTAVGKDYAGGNESYMPSMAASD